MQYAWPYMTVLLATDASAEENRTWLDALSQALPDEQFVTVRNATIDPTIDVAMVANPPAGSLAGLPALRLIQSLWAGVNSLLNDASVPTDVPLARMVDPAMNDAMAQTALWAVLGLHRGFFECAQHQREHRWGVHAQRRADEIDVAVLGLGQMGSRVARSLVREGYRVIGWSERAKAIDGVRCHAGAAALPTVLGQAHIVVNLLPLTAATAGLLDARTLAALPDGAALVNLARGAHVVEADLLAVLDSGRLQRAVLDVFAIEPLPADHPFWGHPRVTVLPHIAAQTDPRSAAQVAASNVRALRAGRALQHLVDRSRGY
jgi:glyoxylate/hydroxypyruvate reductase A